MEHCAKHHLTLFAVYACVTAENLTPTAIHGLSYLSDELTSRMSMRLLLCVGLPVVITRKQGAKSPVTTGTMGTVVRIVWPRDTEFTNHFDPGAGIMVKVPSRLPEVVQVLLRGREEEQLDPGLPKGVVQITPFTERALEVKLHANQAPFKVRVVQIPLVPCFSLVVDKVQGLTLHGVIIGKLAEGRTSCPRTALYVAITRVTSVEHLSFLAPLTLRDLQYFRPEAELLDEVKRLEGLCKDSNL
jgi:hypothetical protein